ncbi:MAG: universal stress protein [Anaerolineae bacterium]|nr:universal stress protein [Anaerolineae bacterium]
MYKTILVPLDGSATSEMALPIASALARSLAARLVLTEAVRDGGRNGPGAAASDTRGVDEAAAYLTSLAARLTDEGLEVATATPYGSAAHGILDEIDTQGADLVVMTTHGRSGFSRLRHGSVAETVLTHSPVPVLLVRADEYMTQPTFERTSTTLLVPLDGSVFAEEAIPPAVALAQAIDATIVLGHVHEPPMVRHDDILTDKSHAKTKLERDQAEVEAYMAQMSQHVRDLGLRARTVVRSGDVVQALLEECWTTGASIIVMATHGRTGLQRALYGSVALDILRHGTLPVLLVRPSDFARGRPAPADMEPAGVSGVGMRRR